MEALADVRLPDGLDGQESFILHPALLDACFQALVGASPAGLGGARQRTSCCCP